MSSNAIHAAIVLVLLAWIFWARRANRNDGRR